MDNFKIIMCLKKKCNNFNFINNNFKLKSLNILKHN